ncbi:MAG: single-stranded-DNA-specific exonuclease RecJ, partial [Bdellovibrionales bacterium]|nr:single-stranded-DNA-specific exonuclease RecJ [Bdellovibrionales bacterium]
MLLEWRQRTNVDNSVHPPTDIPMVIWEWLATRGVTSHQQVENLRRASLKTLKSPFVIKGMEKAVSRIISALDNAESICIYGDFDMDGTPAVAILYKGLESLGFKNLSYYQPSRLDEGYGLHSTVLKKLKHEGINLVITVDLGITAVAEADLAQDLSLDLIITDHHLPGEKIPNAYAVINPNQQDCPSELGYLSGTGVAFYLLMAIKQKMTERGYPLNNFNAKKFVDLFALGTIADMVPLQGDNRPLVKHGLIQLAKTEHLGLRELLKSLDLWGRPLHSSDVAMKLAPSLNALSRLELDTRPIEILLCQNKEKAIALSQQAQKTNQLRKDLQQKAYLIAKDKLSEVPPNHFIYVASEKFHKGVIGLVATKLMQEYNLPTFVGYIHTGKVIGSSRAPEENTAIDLTRVLAGASRALTKFGGHKLAAGFELEQDSQDIFITLLEEQFSESLRSSESANELIYDVEVNLSELNPLTMKWLDEFEPYGKDFSPPLFRI